MPDSSESTLMAMGRESPLDVAVMAGAAVLTGLAATAGDSGTGLTPEQSAAICTATISVSAAIRAWFRARRRIRQSRRAARQSGKHATLPPK